MAYFKYLVTPQGNYPTESSPRTIPIVTSDNLATITAAGYLNEKIADAASIILTTDIFDVWYGYVSDSSPGTYAMFTVGNSSGTLTLTAWANPGEVVLPVTANHIAVFTDTLGTIGDDAATAINGGNIQAGLSGTAGYLASFPATAAKGSFRWFATANTGDTLTSLTNAAMGQATALTIPDPGSVSATMLLAAASITNGNLLKGSTVTGRVADLGAYPIAMVSSTFAGGGTTFAFTVAGLVVGNPVVATIAASTNSVAITKAIVTAPGQVTVTFSADPGAATTVNCFAWTAILI